jgi:transposase
VDLEALEAELGTEALIALRDKLLLKHPPEPSHPSVRVHSRDEILNARKRHRFDEDHKPPTTGPVAEAMERRRDVATAGESRREQAQRLGRFFAETYTDARERKRWHVFDRFTGRVAFEPAEPGQRIKLHDDILDKQDALDRMVRLNAYYLSLGVDLGSLPKTNDERALAVDVTKLARHIISDDLWAELLPLIPVEPAGKQTSKPRVTDDRAALAGVILWLRGKAVRHQLPAVDLGCSAMLCRKRLEEWKKAGAWLGIERTLRGRLTGGTRIDWAKVHGDPITSHDMRDRLVRLIRRHLHTANISDYDLSRAIFGHPSHIHRLLAGSGVRLSIKNRIEEYLCGLTLDREPQPLTAI